MSKPEGVHTDKPPLPTFDGITDDDNVPEICECVDAGSSNDPQQKPWILISTLLIVSAFLQSLKPSDPYIPEFMKNVNGYTEQDVNQGPQFRTYAMFVSLPIVSYAAEYLSGYILPIVFGLFCRFFSQLAFFYGNSLTWMRISYSLFGLSHSTKVIYSAFTYSMVPIHVFHRITSYIRCANFLAHVVGGVIGNGLLDYIVIRGFNGDIISPYQSQFHVSQVAVGLGVLLFLVAIFLNYRNSSGNEGALANMKPPAIHSFQDVANLFKRVYATDDLRIWSMWFIFSFGCVDAIWDYQGLLFTACNVSSRHTGYITAATRLGCAFAAVMAGRSRSIFAKHDVGIIILAGGGISCGLFMSGLFHNVYIIYVLFVATMLVNEYCLCATTAQIAVRTDQSIRGIILLLNTFIAMLLQASMQGLSSWMGLEIRAKYQGLGLLMAMATCMFAFIRFGQGIKAMVSRGGRRQPVQAAV